MVWITTVPPAEATGTLADAYRRQAATLGHPSDFSLLGSLDPNLVAARMDLYRASERCPSALTQRQRRIVAYLTSVLNRTPHCASQVRLKLTHTGVPDTSSATWTRAAMRIWRPLRRPWPATATSSPATPAR